MKAYERIIEAAIRLFNRYGTHAITTNHIIEDIAISPGTLYYHFKNKEEIIRLIFQDISAQLTENELKITTFSVQELKSFARSMFSIYYKYRFFYLDLPLLLQRDEKLEYEYEKNYTQKIKNMRQQLQRSIEQQLIKPFKSKEEFQIFQDLLWIITDFFFTHVQATKREITEEDIERAVKAWLFFIKPYLAK